MPAGHRTHPRRLVHHAHQRLGVVGVVEALHHVLATHLACEVEVGGDGDTAKMRRHVRHELHRQAEVATGLLLVGVAGERIRHQVVAQLVGIVLVRGRGAGAGIAGYAEAHRRRGQQILQRRDRELDRGGVAAGIADVLLAAPLVAGELGQAVVPGAVEAIVGGQIEDQRLGLRLVDRLDIRRRLAVRQGEHHHVGALRGHRAGIQAGVAQLAGVAVHVVGHALAIELARGNEGQLQRRMGRDEADQFGAGVAAGADDAEGFACNGHDCSRDVSRPASAGGWRNGRRSARWWRSRAAHTRTPSSDPA